MMTDPAQSAPSAERESKMLGRELTADEKTGLENFATLMKNEVIPQIVADVEKRGQLANYSRLGILDMLRTEQEMHNAWRKRAEEAETREQAAALRTAQLERERQQVLDILWKDIDCERDEKSPLIHVAAKASNAIYWRNQDITVLRTRAETAECALRDARQIVERYKVQTDSLREIGAVFYSRSHIRPSAEIVSAWECINETSEAARALLTVAAQTPQQVKNTGEKEEK